MPSAKDGKSEALWTIKLDLRNSKDLLIINIKSDYRTEINSFYLQRHLTIVRLSLLGRLPYYTPDQKFRMVYQTQSIQPYIPPSEPPPSTNCLHQTPSQSNHGFRCSGSSALRVKNLEEIRLSEKSHHYFLLAEGILQSKIYHILDEIFLNEIFLNSTRCCR